MSQSAIVIMSFMALGVPIGVLVAVLASDRQLVSRKAIQASVNRELQKLRETGC